ncbi:MAG: hypothetical protein WBH00_18850, partial [Xanthobacteraceae bacterium]
MRRGRDMVIKQLCDFKDDVCQGRCVVAHRSLANLRRRWNVISGPTAFPGPYFGSSPALSARFTAICANMIGLRPSAASIKISMACCQDSLPLSDFGNAMMCSAACRKVWMIRPDGSFTGRSNLASHGITRTPRNAYTADSSVSGRLWFLPQLIDQAGLLADAGEVGNGPVACVARLGPFAKGD